jgi:hypothetical protein
MARRAEPVQGDARNALGQPGQEQRHARDVAVVLARLVGAAEEDLIYLWHRGPREQTFNRQRSEIVRPDAGESAANPSDRGPHCIEDHRVHAPISRFD